MVEAGHAAELGLSPHIHNQHHAICRHLVAYCRQFSITLPGCRRPHCRLGAERLAQVYPQLPLPCPEAVA